MAYRPDAHVAHAADSHCAPAVVRTVTLLSLSLLLCCGSCSEATSGRFITVWVLRYETLANETSFRGLLQKQAPTGSLRDIYSSSQTCSNYLLLHPQLPLSSPLREHGIGPPVLRVESWCPHGILAPTLMWCVISSACSESYDGGTHQLSEIP